MPLPSVRERNSNGTFTPIPIEVRLWGRTVAADASACWEYRGDLNDSGYGVIRHLGKMRGAHRVAWALTHGTIQAGLHVCHRCDNPPCINPSHLFLGTIADNNRDRHAKGRTKNLEAGRAKRHAAIRSRTHCPHGHAYDDANTLIRTDGSRECRACGRAESARYVAANRERVLARRQELRRLRHVA